MTAMNVLLLHNWGIGGDYGFLMDDDELAEALRFQVDAGRLDDAAAAAWLVGRAPDGWPPPLWVRDVVAADTFDRYQQAGNRHVKPGDVVVVSHGRRGPVAMMLSHGGRAITLPDDPPAFTPTPEWSPWSASFLVAADEMLASNDRHADVDNAP